MTGQPRLRAACFGSSIALAACLPLDDLSEYSSASVIPFAGGASGSGGTASGAPSVSASSGGTLSGEGMGGDLSLDPSNMEGRSGAAGALGDSGGGASSLAGTSDAGACSGDGEFAEAEGQSCYRLTADTALWVDARAACLSWGGDLVSIESAAEDDFLTSRSTIDVWIGANDRELEGTLVWADGSPLVYTNWGDAQPDDFGAQEDCGEKRVVDAGGWNDRPCDGTLQEFLCER